MQRERGSSVRARASNARVGVLGLQQQARANLEEARVLREAGRSYREIGRRLRLTSAQLCRIRRILSREKGTATRLRQKNRSASARDLSVSGSDLPPSLRRALVAAGYRTLGGLADRLAAPELPGLEAIASIGPVRASMVHRLLDRHGLRAGPDDLQARVEAIFPGLLS